MYRQLFCGSFDGGNNICLFIFWGLCENEVDSAKNLTHHVLSFCSNVFRSQTMIDVSSEPVIKYCDCLVIAIQSTWPLWPEILNFYCAIVRGLWEIQTPIINTLLINQRWSDGITGLWRCGPENSTWRAKFEDRQREARWRHVELMGSVQ